MRKLEMCDKNAFFDLKSDPTVTEKYLQNPMNRIESDLKLATLIKKTATGKSYTYAVLDKKAGKFLGTITVMELAAFRKFRRNRV